jgi:hypothetical protein
VPYLFYPEIRIKPLSLVLIYNPDKYFCPYVQPACQSSVIPLGYNEEKGYHDWFIWNEQIQRFLVDNLKTPLKRHG